MTQETRVPQQLLTAVRVGRIAIGGALMAAPRVAEPFWIGPDAQEPGARVLARAIGARDVAMRLGTLQALRAGADAGRGARAAVLADSADCLATASGRPRLNGMAVFAFCAGAAGFAAAGLWTQGRLG